MPSRRKSSAKVGTRKKPIKRRSAGSFNVRGAAEPSRQSGEPIRGQPPELRLLYDTAPIGLAFLTTDCRYVMINERLTEICGISVAGHIGRTVRETVPQVAEQVESLVKTIVRTGEPITGIEVNGQRPDGANVDRVWITYWHPLRNRRGNVIGINVAAEEITDRKRTEAALAASQKRLVALNETLAERVEMQAQERDRLWKLAQDLLVVGDIEGTILNVNPAWSTTLGWSAADLVGSRGEDLVHPDDRARSRAELASLIAGGRTQYLENRVRCRDGSYRWLSWFAVADRGLIYATARDITNVVRAREESLALRQQLADASRYSTMGAMTGSIAHEIKQPLGAIAMNANAGLRWLGAADPELVEARTALRQIVDNVQRIAQVIDGIRAMFRKDPGRQEPVDLRTLIRQILALAQGELKTRRVTVADDMPEKMPRVMADRVQLQQVLLNLVMNAIEAMSTVTDRERRLTVALEDAGARDVTITIADTGDGINPDHLSRIFDPFFTTKAHGMGLGLSVSRSIVEAHGGKIAAAPRQPFGTVFSLTLPIDPSRAGSDAGTAD